MELLDFYKGKRVLVTGDTGFKGSWLVRILHLAIFQAMGDCIMPREGVFTKVLHGGVIKEGDNLEILEEA